MKCVECGNELCYCWHDSLPKHIGNRQYRKCEICEMPCCRYCAINEHECCKCIHNTKILDMAMKGEVVNVDETENVDVEQFPRS